MNGTERSLSCPGQVFTSALVVVVDLKFRWHVDSMEVSKGRPQWQPQISAVLAQTTSSATHVSLVVKSLVWPFILMANGHLKMIAETLVSLTQLFREPEQRLDALRCIPDHDVTGHPLCTLRSRSYLFWSTRQGP